MLPDRSTARAISGLVFAAMVASALGVPVAHAGDLPVTYAVQEKALKGGLSMNCP